MGWIADLLKEIPSAARYKGELEEMEKENATLKAENTLLKSEVEGLRKETERQKQAPDAPNEAVEKILAFLAKNECSTASQIARALSLNKPVAEMHLEDLIASKHIEASYAAGQEPEYYLEQTGRRYLHAKGLL